MHELSIALAILDMAGEESARRGGARVEAVHLRIGPLSGVAVEALRSAWDLARESTPFAASRLVIEATAVAVDCPACGGRRPAVSATDIRCGACGGPAPDVVGGREVEVVALEVVEPEVSR